eukprot:3279245-Amphidinium_carterae.1
MSCYVGYHLLILNSRHVKEERKRLLAELAARDGRLGELTAEVHQRKTPNGSQSPPPQSSQNYRNLSGELGVDGQDLLGVGRL